jgi:hypothetical protein
MKRGKSVATSGHVPCFRVLDSQRWSGTFRIARTLEPGDYALEVAVGTAAARKKRDVATQWIDFEVVQ